MSKIFERNPDTGQIRSRDIGDYGNETIINKEIPNWLIELVKRSGIKRACIALANKTVRTAWALLATGKEYTPAVLNES